MRFQDSALVEYLPAKGGFPAQIVVTWEEFPEDEFSMELAVALCLVEDSRDEV